MNEDRRIAVVTGVLFIAATTASLTGNSFTGPLLNAPDYLSRMSSNGDRIIIGALLSFIAAACSSSIAIALYPILKRYGEGLAMEAVGFRLIEGVFYIVNTICLLTLLTVSQEFVQVGGQSASQLQTIGHLLLAARDLAGFVFAVLAFCTGALMYYVIFYRSKLIPRWLSVWGIIAILMLLSAVFITLFDGEPFSISGSLVGLALPIAVQEIVMAVWLIVKGFAPPAITAGSTTARIGQIHASSSS